jgi:hypothetical protein
VADFAFRLENYPRTPRNPRLLLFSRFKLTREDPCKSVVDFAFRLENYPRTPRLLLFFRFKLTREDPCKSVVGFPFCLVFLRVLRALRGELPGPCFLPALQSSIRLGTHKSL